MIANQDDFKWDDDAGDISPTPQEVELWEATAQTGCAILTELPPEIPPDGWGDFDE